MDLIARTRRAVQQRDALARPWIASLVAMGVAHDDATVLIAYAIERALRERVARASWPC